MQYGSVLTAAAVLSTCITSVAGGSWGLQGGDSWRSNTNQAVVTEPNFDSLRGTNEGGADFTIKAPRKNSFPFITPPTPTFVPSAQFSMASDFHLQKTPGSTVTSKGNVAFISDDCALVVLANPDSATSASFWSSVVYSDVSAVSTTLHSNCADLVLDENDKAYTVTCEYNSLTCLVFGWDLSTPATARQLPWSPAPLVQSAFPRILELYTMGLFYNAGKVFFPAELQPLWKRCRGSHH